MRYLQVGDATYVGSIGGASGGWSRPYFDGGGKAFVNTPASLKELFAGIDAQIKTPLAFAILAPEGWPGERAWEGFNPESMEAHGWTPRFWKESTHYDKTWVQLYVRQLPDNKWPESNLVKDEQTSHPVSYGSEKMPGCLPYMGCSSFFMSFDKTKAPVEIPKFSSWYGSGSYPTKQTDVFTFMRVARPMLSGELTKLKDQGFSEVAVTPFSRYLVRGKEGIGTKAKCAY